ncbi:MAG: sulfide/dihydroorotate dehydrogenase-like FAD/NAD-binding protein [Spirochaetaceae bacterium]|nr:sulfide/dihydroorotate dehydrogenase-like FAD/NAD-binding protein [Spirochaetaceae bacterium]
MYDILEKKQFSTDVFYMKIMAPEIAENRKSGQFVIVQLNTEFGERIPLTIADASAKDGWIALVIQAVGATTIKLCQMNVGDKLGAVLGPLGVPSEIEPCKHVVAVAGGIGAAPLYPIVEDHKKCGNYVSVIIGARTKDLIIFEEEMKKVADNVIIVTDDGSYGKKALVTEPLKELCESANPPDLAIAIGPPIMMKFSAKTTEPFNIKTIVSLNTIMIDGTGMCGCCRVEVGGETRFVCIDGPDFDGHKVNFDNMMSRMKTFKQREDADRHTCRIGLTN